MTAIVVDERLEAVPPQHRPRLLGQGAACSSSAAPRTRTSGPSSEHQPHGRGGRDDRHPRPQRLGQVDAAEVHRRHPQAHDRRRSACEGRIASLLELGAGFHPDLTGRENVYINASFLGIPRKEIEKHFDDIVAFAELEHFIDQQVKYYSSGMYVRLGFAVAINVDPDILLVDEVLAVGDEVFQKKCLDRIEQIQQEGKTILFVTHGADLARKICDRVVVLDHGAHGGQRRARRVDPHLPRVPARPPHRRRRRRRRRVAHGHTHDPADPHHGGRAGASRPARPALPLRRRAAHDPGRRSRPPSGCVDAVLGFEVRDTDRRGALRRRHRHARHARCRRSTGPAEIAIAIGGVPLLDGAFPISIQLKDRHDGRLLDFREGQDVFEVVNPIEGRRQRAAPGLGRDDRSPSTSTAV